MIRKIKTMLALAVLVFSFGLQAPAHAQEGVKHENQTKE